METRVVKACPSLLRGWLTAAFHEAHALFSLRQTKLIAPGKGFAAPLLVLCALTCILLMHRATLKYWARIFFCVRCSRGSHHSSAPALLEICSHVDSALEYLKEQQYICCVPPLFAFRHFLYLIDIWKSCAFFSLGWLRLFVILFYIQLMIIVKNCSLSRTFHPSPVDTYLLLLFIFEPRVCFLWSDEILRLLERCLILRAAY